MIEIEHLKPSEIRYSQDSISNTFGFKSSHPYVHIGETLDDLIEGRIDIDDIPEISVQRIGDKWVSADNRRLWVFKHLERFRKCATIQCIVVENIDGDKRSSTNDGLSVRIRNGGNPGGRYFSLLSVLEDFIKDYDKERKELKKRNEDNENDLRHFKALVGQLNSKISKMQNEKKNEQESNLKIFKRLNRSREINQKYAEVNSEQSAEIGLSKEKLVTSTKRLVDKVSELELKLFKSREQSWTQMESYKNMETAYKEKTRALEMVILKHSQSATENAKKLRTTTTELEYMTKDYRLLKLIHTKNTLTIEKLRKEIETIKQDYDKLKQDIENKDKGLVAIRKLTDMYGPVQAVADPEISRTNSTLILNDWIN